MVDVYVVVECVVVIVVAVDDSAVVEGVMVEVGIGDVEVVVDVG